MTVISTEHWGGRCCSLHHPSHPDSHHPIDVCLCLLKTVLPQNITGCKTPGVHWYVDASTQNEMFVLLQRVICLWHILPQLGVQSSLICLHLYMAYGRSESSKLKTGYSESLITIRTCTQVDLCGFTLLLCPPLDKIKNSFALSVASKLVYW